MNVTYAICITAAFRSEIAEQMAYLSQVSDSDSVLVCLKKTWEKINRLSSFPYLGKESYLRSLHNLGNRLLVVDSFLILYKVDEISKTVYLIFFALAKRKYLFFYPDSDSK